MQFKGRRHCECLIGQTYGVKDPPKGVAWCVGWASAHLASSCQCAAVRSCGPSLAAVSGWGRLLGSPVETAVCLRWAVVCGRCPPAEAATGGIVGAGGAPSVSGAVTCAGLGVDSALHGPMGAYGGVWRPDYHAIVLCGRHVLLGPVVVVVMRFIGCLRHLMLWCGPVCCVRLVACGSRLCWGVVVMVLVGLAVVLGHREAWLGDSWGVLVLLVVPSSLALQEWQSLCGANWLERRSLCGLCSVVLV